MFLVEHYKDLGVDSVTGVGCHSRRLRLFKTLAEAIKYRKSLSEVELHCSQTREATRNDLWELAQTMFTMAADACAQQNYSIANVYSAKGTLLVELAAGKDVQLDKVQILLYASVEGEEDRHG